MVCSATDHTNLNIETKPIILMLYVDDTEINRIIFNRLVKNYNKLPERDYFFRCITASTGEEACELYNQQPSAYPVIVLDFEMPGLNGAQTAAKIKEISQAFFKSCTPDLQSDESSSLNSTRSSVSMSPCAPSPLFFTSTNSPAETTECKVATTDSPAIVLDPPALKHRVPPLMLAYSSSKDPAHLEACKQAGVVVWLTKPCKNPIQEISDIVQRYTSPDLFQPNILGGSI